MLLQLILGDSAAKTKVTPGHNDTLLQIVDCRIWVSNSYATQCTVVCILVRTASFPRF